MALSVDNRPKNNIPTAVPSRCTLFRGFDSGIHCGEAKIRHAIVTQEVFTVVEIATCFKLEQYVTGYSYLQSFGSVDRP